MVPKTDKLKIVLKMFVKFLPQAVLWETAALKAACLPTLSFPKKKIILANVVSANTVWFQKMSISPPPTHRRDWKFLGVVGSQRPKFLRKCMKLNWNFQSGGGGGRVLGKIPFMGEVWIIYGTTHCNSAFNGIECWLSAMSSKVGILLEAYSLRKNEITIISLVH